ncbi:MAG: TonB-dependent receptor plug domain-containing protein, partial [Bacteroidia bacterium]
GNHFPIEQIKKIEVIRGPGSAIYGGFAEYGVINIITRQAEDINGVTVSGTYGQMEKDYGRRNVNLAIGKKFGDVSFSLSGMLGQGQRSDQTYRDFKDTSYSMAGNSSLDTKYFNAALGYKGLSFRVIGDFYSTRIGDGYGDVIKSGIVAENFNSVYSELKYVIKFNDKFTLTPRLNYKSQTPWQSPEYTGTKAYNRTATRATGNLTASWNVNRHINFVFGAETYQDKATDYVDSSYFSNGTQHVTYYNYSFFAQGLIKTRIVNFIVGARYDRHNVYGHAFVPRVGLTKKYNKFHFKALFSNSFRAPAIENIDGANIYGIKPELTQVMEVELGYQVTRKSILTVNAYDITTRNPIIYYTDSTNSDYYTNSGHSGTQGVEAEYRIKDKWGYVTLNYAFYSVANKEKVSSYAVSGSSSSLVGFANHRVNFNACFNITKALSFNASGSYYGSRWAYTRVDTLGNPVQEKLSPAFLLNCFVKYNTPVRGLSIGVGCYDILNQKFLFVQAYNGGHAPLPGPSREIVFRLQYNLNFNRAKD